MPLKPSSEKKQEAEKLKDKSTKIPAKTTAKTIAGSKVKKNVAKSVKKPPPPKKTNAASAVAKSTKAGEEKNSAVTVSEKPSAVKERKQTAPNAERAAFMASLRETAPILIEEVNEKLLEKENEATGDVLSEAVAEQKQPPEKTNTSTIEMKAIQAQKAKQKKAKQAKASRKRKPGGGLLDAFGKTRIGAFFGRYLYLLGFYAENRMVQVWRFLHDAGLFLGQMIGLLLGRFGKVFSVSLKNLGKDFTSPLTHFKENVSEIRDTIEEETQEAKEAAKRPGKGFVSYIKLVATFASYLLPLVAAGVLVFTVNSLLNRPYLLAVGINGETVGYVADELALEDAKNMLRGRIRLTPEQSVKDWSLTPVYAIASDKAITTKSQLVDNILRATVDDPNGLVPASGLYFGTELFAVTTEGDKLEEFLQARLVEAENPEHPEAEVSFVRDVSYDKESDQVLYFTAGVIEYGELISKLSSSQPPQNYEVNDGDTLLSIAANAGTTADLLRARNPELKEKGDEFEPEEGSTVLLRRAQPFLQVKMTTQVEEEENIPFEVEYVEVSTRVKGSEYIVQQGVVGIQMVMYDYEYVDGELISRLPNEETEIRVIQEAIKSIIQVGTHVAPTIGGGEYSSAYMWPAPVFKMVTRGVQPNHRGLDITGATDAPIYASNQGVITEAGYHYSWGNNVVIRHPDGLETRYAHLNSMAVNVDDVVGQGQVIGYMGTTGVSTGTHLHFEVLINGGIVDPYLYVSSP